MIAVHLLDAAMTAEQWTAAGRSFEPDLHFTGFLPEHYADDDGDKTGAVRTITAINYMLAQHGTTIVAYHFIQNKTFYSLELEFTSDAAATIATETMSRRVSRQTHPMHRVRRATR